MYKKEAVIIRQIKLHVILRFQNNPLWLSAMVSTSEEGNITVILAGWPQTLFIVILPVEEEEERRLTMPSAVAHLWKHGVGAS